MFDLSGVTGSIVSATFQISAATFVSPDASETVSLFDPTTPLTNVIANTGGVAAYNDLGSGTIYGSRVFTAADPLLSPTSIALNSAAVTDLNGTSGLFGFGAAMTSITGLSQQSVFGGSDGPYVTTLVLETAPVTAPEPGSLLLGTVFGAFAFRRRLGWR